MMMLGEAFQDTYIGNSLTLVYNDDLWGTYYDSDLLQHVDEPALIEGCQTAMVSVVTQK